MGKVIGLLILLAALWTGIEIYANGWEGAFGRSVAGPRHQGEPAAPEQANGYSQTLKRARSAVDRSYRQTEKRYDDILDE